MQHAYHHAVLTEHTASMPTMLKNKHHALPHPMASSYSTALAAAASDGVDNDVQDVDSVGSAGGDCTMMQQRMHSEERAALAIGWNMQVVRTLSRGLGTWYMGVCVEVHGCV